MIASSKPVKVAVLVGAAALHVGLSGEFFDGGRVELESTQGAAQAALGSSFADMIQGVMTAQPVEAEAEPVKPVTELQDSPPPEPTDSPLPEPTDRAKPVETADAPEPNSAKTPDVAPSKTAEVKQTPVPTVEPSARPQPADTVTARAPLGASAVVAAATPVSPTPLTPLTSQPIRAETATRVEPAQTQTTTVATSVIATTPEQAAPVISKRPKRRDPAKEIKVASRPKTDTRAKPKKETRAKPKQQPKGNAKRNARAGAATGQKEAKAATQGTKSGKAKTSGNAAASNYPGLVMRRLARARKVRGVGRGKAEVNFKIASNGGLAGARLTRSSGSGALDRAALRAVRNAAPFPPPPAGAQRSFRIVISGG
ncbi:MAG: TonB family protein [Pseudomonadota bacterium]